jgi:hypothetical protein
MAATLVHSLSKGCLVVWFSALGCASSAPHHTHSAADESSEHETDEHSADVDQDIKPAPRPVNNVREAAGDAKRDNEAPAKQGDDVQAVLQLTVDDGELDQYLKLGEPGRFPLKIAGSAVPQNIELVKATKPVVVTTAPSDKKQAVLVITAIDIQANEASVSYRYDVEGIRGTAYLKKTPHGWELTRSRIVEH